MNYANCRECHEQVLWVRAKSGSKVILNVEPDDERGNIIVDGFGFAHHFPDHASAVAAALARGLDDPCYLDHHATCVEWAKRRQGPRHSVDPAAPEQSSLF